MDRARRLLHNRHDALELELEHFHRGTRDPALKVDIQGEAGRRAAGVDTIHRLPGKRFLQEGRAPAIADLVAGITRD